MATDYSNYPACEYRSLSISDKLLLTIWSDLHPRVLPRLGANNALHEQN